MSDRPDPVVTVIVPVRNEAAYIEQTLAQIRDQTYPKPLTEVIVADGMSTDDTRAIVTRFAAEHPELDLKVLSNPKRLSSAGRNLAIAHGRGEYFLLIDGHVFIPRRDLIRTAVDLARRHGARVLGRPQPLSPPGIDRFQRAVAVARTSWLAHSQESHIYSGTEGWVSPLSVATMYHASVFAEVGMFDEQFDAAEDVELNYRLERRGIRCFTSPRLAVYYYPRRSLPELFRQMLRYGRGRAAFIRKHPERFRVELLAPVALVLAGPIGLALGAMSVWALVALAALGGLYAGVLAIESLRVNRRHGCRFFGQVPCIIATIHAGLGVGLISGALRTPAPAVCEAAPWCGAGSRREDSQTATSRYSARAKE